MMAIGERIPGSFKDPSGFVFRCEGHILRQVNGRYKEHYDLLMRSGLYDFLVESQFLIAHEEVSLDYRQSCDAYLILRPDPIPFVSYPYEWCFSQLKSAALLTLQVQQQALSHGMSLKDCSAYNVQFKGANPIFIDTLSFEPYVEGRPWVAFRQFCQHYLAPLALMSYRDVRFNQWFRIHMDGIPLDLAALLLPLRTWLSLPLVSFIHLHSRAQKYYADKTVKPSGRGMSHRAFLGLLDQLESAISKLKWKPRPSEWSEYYCESGYSQEAFEAKKGLLERFIDRASPGVVWDLGSNTGLMSRIASDKGIMTIALDSDPSAVEASYLECLRKKDGHLLPLLVDLTNPSPSLGWAGSERMSLAERGPVDMAMALALIHHLAISNNVPLENISEFLAGIAKFLIVEFVPKDDPQVKRLLSSRTDMFSDYNKTTFENVFRGFFEIMESCQIAGSHRILYFMKNISVHQDTPTL